MKHDRGFCRPKHLWFSCPALLILVMGTVLAIWSPPSVDTAESRINSISPRPLSDLEPHYRASVLRGWRHFQTSFARDGVACIHCHPRHDTMRLWAGAYPKVEVFDGTPYKIKGLREVVGEAMERHTDLIPEQRLALVEDLVSYIAWWGDGQSIDPGHSRGLRPAAEDLAELRSSVERGRKRFREVALGPCTECHHAGEQGPDRTKISVAGAATTFPHYVAAAARVMSMEAFLSWHLASEGRGGYTPESGVVTDLGAYLVSLAKGKRFCPGGQSDGSGGQYHE